MRSKPGREDQLLELIGQIYDTALDDRLWNSLAAKLAATLDATSTAVFLPKTREDASRLLGTTENFDADALAKYESHYARLDLWVERAVGIGLSKVYRSQELVEDGEIRRSEWYNDWCRHLGVFHMVGSVFPTGADELGAIGVHRPHAAGVFSEGDKRLVGCVLPHLQRALQLRRRLGDAAVERTAAHEALDRSATATFVVNGAARILYVNPAAERLLQVGDGLRARHGQLAATDHQAANRLTSLIRQAAGTAAGEDAGSGGVVALPREDRLPLTLLAAPFRPARDGFGPSLPAAVLFVRDPEAPTADALALQALFGLTPAEAKLGSGLAQGQSVEEIAAAVGVSLNTARTHLKSIFAKTGTSRQAQLVALLLGSIATLL